jgi:hypothetical protein
MWAALLDIGFFLLFTGLLLYAMHHWHDLVADSPEDTDQPASHARPRSGPPETPAPPATDPHLAVVVLIIGVGVLSLLASLLHLLISD